jgi:hypothetical protein
VVVVAEKEQETEADAKESAVDFLKLVRAPEPVLTPEQQARQAKLARALLVWGHTFALEDNIRSHDFWVEARHMCGPIASLTCTQTVH